MESVKEGCIDILIDEIVPCLKDSSTGEIVKTRAYQIQEKKLLRSCNKRNGWYINWEKLFEEYEIYAISVNNSDIFEGLIALERNDDYQAEHIVWATVAPHNNALKRTHKRYIGVGGHLFAVGAMVSKSNGFEGCLYGIAKNQTVLKHYMKTFGAEYIPTIDKNGGFVILEKSAEKLMEVYNFE